MYKARRRVSRWIGFHCCSFGFLRYGTMSLETPQKVPWYTDSTTLFYHFWDVYTMILNDIYFIDDTFNVSLCIIMIAINAFITTQS
jgi:hypothetical protein